MKDKEWKRNIVIDAFIKGTYVKHGRDPNKEEFRVLAQVLLENNLYEEKKEKGE